MFDDEVVVRSEFLSPHEISALFDCLAKRRDRGEFRAACIGSGVDLQRCSDVRGDTTCWFTEPAYPAERRLLDALETLRMELNRQAFLGLFDLEVHYAWYPPGASYSRHVDQLRGDRRRRLSLILYLNKDWRPGCGGELRLFDSTGVHRDIAPVAGRLVYFLSSGREHAVLPTAQARFSVSGWFRGRA